MSKKLGQNRLSPPNNGMWSHFNRNHKNFLGLAGYRKIEEDIGSSFVLFCYFVQETGKMVVNKKKQECIEVQIFHKFKQILRVI